MLPIQGLYEIAIRVRELAPAEAFYCNVLGCTVGLRDERRNWVFLRVAGSAAMVVLQEDKGEWPLVHFAFTVAEADLSRANSWLQAHGVATDGPHFHAWMPAKSLYFSDPDGHNLELCAPLPLA